MFLLITYIENSNANQENLDKRRKIRLVNQETNFNLLLNQTLERKLLPPE